MMLVFGEFPVTVLLMTILSKSSFFGIFSVLLMAVLSKFCFPQIKNTDFDKMAMSKTAKLQNNADFDEMAMSKTLTDVSDCFAQVDQSPSENSANTLSI